MSPLKAPTSTTVPPGPAPTSSGSTNPFAQNANGQTPTFGTGTAAAGQSAIPPGAAESPYQYANYVASMPITLGADLAEYFDPAHLPTTGDAFVKAVLALPAAEQMAIEWQLWQAGLYTDAGGNLITGVQLGSYDASNFNALANAVIAANDSGLSLSDLVKRNVGAGTLQGLEAKAAGAVPGGGQTYQVSTPDPRDVYTATQTAYQQTLGRLPTQAEYQSVLDTVNQSSQQYYGAVNTQSEQMERAKYNTALESRTAKLQPTVATNTLPATQPKTPADYAMALLGTMGMQSTASNVAFLMSWIQANGGMGQGYNPLGVTIGASQQTVQGGASTFPTWQAGLVATMRELIEFPNIMAALKSGDASSMLSSKTFGVGIKADLNKWSSGAYSSLNTNAQQKAALTAVDNAPGAQPPGLGAPGGEAGTPAEVERQEARAQQPTSQGAAPVAGPTAAPPATSAQAGPPLSQGPKTPGSAAAVVPPDVMAAYGGNPPQNVIDTWNAAASNPAVAAYLASVAQGRTPTGAPGTPANDIFPGQNVTSPGDTYLQPTTVNVNPPVSPTNAATYAAENLQGGIPYYANQWVQVMKVVSDLINQTASSEHP